MHLKSLLLFQLTLAAVTFLAVAEESKEGVAEVAPAVGETEVAPIADLEGQEWYHKKKCHKKHHEGNPLLF